jgi:hypothetical protein
MKQYWISLLLCVINVHFLFAQTVGIGTSSPHPSSILELNSTNKGLLVPRMTTTERNNIASPANGLVIYNTQTNRFELYNNSWTGLQPEFPAGTSVISDSMNNPALNALGYAYSGSFTQQFAIPAQPVSLPPYQWHKVNQGVQFNVGAPAAAIIDGYYGPIEPDLKDYPVVATPTEFVYFMQDSIYHYTPASDSWSGYPIPTKCIAGVWIGTEVLGWNGRDSIYKYNPSTRSITRLYRPLLSERKYFSLVWTGTEMIVWGGKHTDNTGTTTHFQNGAIYNPATNSWTALPATSFAARAYHSAVWTGTQMIIYGGETSVEKIGEFCPYNSHPVNNPCVDDAYDSIYTFNSLIIYTRSSNTWSAQTTHGSARSKHSAVWTGTEMIAFGGCDYLFYSVFQADWYSQYKLHNLVVWRTGFRFNPGTGVSTALPLATHGRYQHTAIWVGNNMKVIGGYNPEATPLVQTQHYSRIVNSWNIPDTLWGGVVKNVTPYAFYHDNKFYAFGRTLNGREQAYVRSENNTPINLSQAQPAITKNIFVFKKQ